MTKICLGAMLATLSLTACASSSNVWERDRIGTEVDLAAQRALVEARKALEADAGETASCYDAEVEAAGVDFIVSFFSPVSDVPHGVTDVIVTAGEGICGPGRLYAVSRLGVVLGSRLSR